MDIRQARALLSRITRLLDDHHADGSTPSALERDLLMEYTRRFYEALQGTVSQGEEPSVKASGAAAAPVRVAAASESRPAQRQAPEDSPEVVADTQSMPRTVDQPAEPSRQRAAVPPAKPQTQQPSPAPVRQRSSIVFEEFEAAKPEAPAERQTPSRPVLSQAAPITHPQETATSAARLAMTGAPNQPAPTQPAPTQLAERALAPAIIHVPEDVEAEVRRIETHRPAAPAYVEPTQPYTPTPAPTERPSSPSKVTDLEPALRELFTVERAQDLSDRLANAPIKDLTKGMALNERLQFGKELFGGDANLMTETLQRLNSFGGYDEAAVSLASTARRFDWPDSEKVPTARSFIKLVWRRFA